MVPNLIVRRDGGRLSILDSQYKEVALVVADWGSRRAIIVYTIDVSLEQVQSIVSRVWPTLTCAMQQ